MTNIEYYKELSNLKAVLASIGVQLAFQPLQEQAKEIVCPHKKFENLDPSDILSVKFGAEEIFFSCLLLQNSDPQRYGNLTIDLANKYIMNYNNYPRTTQEAKRMLNQNQPRFKSYEEASPNDVTTDDDTTYNINDDDDNNNNNEQYGNHENTGVRNEQYNNMEVPSETGVQDHNSNDEGLNDDYSYQSYNDNSNDDNDSNNDYPYLLYYKNNNGDQS